MVLLSTPIYCVASMSQLSNSGVYTVISMLALHLRCTLHDPNVHSNSMYNSDVPGGAHSSSPHAANISTMAVIYSVLHTLNFNMKLDLLTNDDSHVIYTD